MKDKSAIRTRYTTAMPSCFFALLLLIGVALPAAAKTTVDFDPGLDFSKFKTFAFIGPVENLVQIMLNPDAIDTRMHRMVVRELEKKGLHEVNPGQNADLVVRYWASSASSVNVAAMGNWAPYGPYIEGRWASVYNAVTSSSQRDGALILDLIDSRGKALVWRLYLVRKLSDPEKDWKKADEEFTEGFKNYPPTDKDKSEKHREQERQDPSRKPS